MSRTPLPENIQCLEHAGQRWLNIEHPDNAALNYLKNEFDFHVLDYEDIASSTHRSKVDKYHNYLFLVMLFPVFNRKTKQVESSEIDFFLGKDYLITIHRGEIPTFIDMFQLCEASDQAKESLMNTSSQFLLYKILQRLLQYCYPLMDHIDLEIEETESKIFSTGGQKLLQEILFVRHNIIDMRKIMQPHRATISRLKKPSITIAGHETFEHEDKYNDYFDDLLDYTQEIWNQLESFKEAVDALHETNESLISHRINEVMKTLTLFSVILLPAGVVAGMFGMNAKFIPFAGHELGFYMMVTITFSAIILTLTYIRRRKIL